MELNHECVRDLLLAIEKHTTINNELDHDEIINLPELKSYNEDIVIYTAQKLNEAGFVNGTFDFFYGNRTHINISSLTYNGHNFLDTIRDKSVWVKTKSVASKVSSVSLPILFDIGTTVLKEQLGLP